MLYSAKHNFIYSKSAKTASTSTEMTLEYLIRGKPAQAITNSILYSDGSRIGARGQNFEKTDPNFDTPAFSRNHQSLKETSKMLGDNIFNSAYKISSIRNPYDRLISAFHHLGKQNLENYIKMKEDGEVSEIKKEFMNFLLNPGPSQYDGSIHFCVDGKVRIDKFIRQEYICRDIEEALDHLKVPSETKDIILQSIPRAKETKRADSNLLISDYYTDDTLNMANERYATWFELGGYTLCKAVKDLDQSLQS